MNYAKSHNQRKSFSGWEKWFISSRKLRYIHQSHFHCCLFVPLKYLSPQSTSQSNKDWIGCSTTHNNNYYYYYYYYYYYWHSLPCTPACLWAESQKCSQEESSSGNAGESGNKSNIIELTTYLGMTQSWLK